VVNVATPRRGSSLGLAAVILGSLAFLICWIPLLGLLGVPLAAVGLLLGGIGVIVALTRRGAGVGFAIAGVVLSGVALGVSITFYGALTAAFVGLGEALAEAEERASETNQTVAGADGPEAIEWAPHDAAVRQGDVELVITELAVRTVEIVETFGDGTGRLEGEWLVVAFEVSNMSDARKLDYRAWRESGVFDSQPRLGDDAGNAYKQIGTYHELVGASRNVESVYPGASVADVLIFEPPVGAATHLDLELPAANFGGEGTIRFRIPAEAIERG
jgi:hypothetical protein